MLDVSSLLDYIREKSLEFFGIHYGTYRAIVTDNKDPLGSGRVQVYIENVGDDFGPNHWFSPAFLGGAGKKRGTFWVPDIGDAVYVCFDGGNTSRPKCYFGGWHGTGEVPDALAPDPKTKIPYKKGMVTRLGHSLVFDEQPGKETVKLAWHKPSSTDPAAKTTDEGFEETANLKTGSSAFLAISNGGVLLANQTGTLFNMGSNGNSLWMNSDGSYVLMDASGVTIVTSNGIMVNLAGGSATITAPQDITLAAPSITLEAAGIFVGPLKTELLAWLKTHLHYSAVGSTAPPTQAGLL